MPRSRKLFDTQLGLLLDSSEGLMNDDQTTDLRRYLENRFDTLDRDLARLHQHDEARVAAITKLAERVAVVESTLRSNGGLVTKEECRLREDGIARSMAATEAKVDALERIYVGLSKRLWWFMGSSLFLLAGAVASIVLTQ